MASLNVRCVLAYQDAPWGTAPASKSAVAHTVIKEYKPRSAGVVRRMARSDHWRWVSIKVSTALGESDLDLPTPDEVGQDQHRIEFGIGAEEGLRLALAGGIAHQDPAQRDRRRAAAVLDGDIGGDDNRAGFVAIPAGERHRAP